MTGRRSEYSIRTPASGRGSYATATIYPKNNPTSTITTNSHAVLIHGSSGDSADPTVHAITPAPIRSAAPLASYVSRSVTLTDADRRVDGIKATVVLAGIAGIRPPEPVEPIAPFVFVPGRRVAR